MFFFQTNVIQSVFGHGCSPQRINGETLSLVDYLFRLLPRNPYMLYVLSPSRMITNVKRWMWNWPTISFRFKIATRPYFINLDKASFCLESIDYCNVMIYRARLPWYPSYPLSKGGVLIQFNFHFKQTSRTMLISSATKNLCFHNFIRSLLSCYLVRYKLSGFRFYVVPHHSYSTYLALRFTTVTSISF